MATLSNRQIDNDVNTICSMSNTKSKPAKSAPTSTPKVSTSGLREGLNPNRIVQTRTTALPKGGQQMNAKYNPRGIVQTRGQTKSNTKKSSS